MKKNLKKISFITIYLDVLVPHVSEETTAIQFCQGLDFWDMRFESTSPNFFSIKHYTRHTCMCTHTRVYSKHIISRFSTPFPSPSPHQHPKNEQEQKTRSTKVP